MTREEAVSLIQTAKAEIEWEYPLEYAEAFEKAIQDIGNRERYKWHDLKKNPMDLPNVGDLASTYGEVYICTKSSAGVKCYKKERYSDWGNCFMNTPINRVIGWRYIEPFVEEV